ncbi:SRPBCC family protein [candidate division KSB1 bacterium]|nr:SRPBCC family protein [candidate division KSB1 bacterium]
MINVTVTIPIRRRPSDVFSFIANFTNNTRWQKNIVEIYYTTEPPIQIGSEFTRVGRFLGRRFVSAFKVIDYEPGRLIKTTTVKGTFPIICTRIVEPTEDGCRVTAFIEADAGPLKLAAPLLRNTVQSSMTKDYEKLKELLEK